MGAKLFKDGQPRVYRVQIWRAGMRPIGYKVEGATFTEVKEKAETLLTGIGVVLAAPLRSVNKSQAASFPVVGETNPRAAWVDFTPAPELAAQMAARNA